jgi:hypothetical protein
VGIASRALHILGKALWLEPHPLVCPMSFSFLSFFLLFFATWVWTQGLELFARQALYHLSHTASPFCLMDFMKRVSQFMPWLPACLAGMPGTLHQT